MGVNTAQYDMAIILSESEENLDKSKTDKILKGLSGSVIINHNEVEFDKLKNRYVFLHLEPELPEIEGVKHLYKNRKLISDGARGLKSVDNSGSFFLRRKGAAKLFADTAQSKDKINALKYRIEEETFSFIPVSQSNFPSLPDFNIRLGLINRIKRWKYYLSSLSTKDTRQSTRMGGLFYFLSLIFLMLIVYFGQTAGISGDEFRYDRQSSKVYEYFKTFGEDKRATTSTGIDPQHYNAQSFDVVVYTFQKWMGIEDKFIVRHFFNSLIAWLGIFMAGLLAARLFGWQVGIMTIFLLFISPQYLGNGLNNHRDIPVATFYISSLYFLIKYISHYVNPSWRTIALLTLSVAGTFSIRFAAGILTIGIIGVSLGFHFLYRLIKKRDRKELSQIIVRHGLTMLIISLGSITIGNILWPFAWEDPIKNMLEVFEASGNLGVSVKQIFEGEHIWSNQIPEYFTLKYMSITTPIFILIGLLLHFVFAFKLWKNKKALYFLILTFATAFPLIYASQNVKNDYGGWRHFLFVYPSLSILASTGILYLKNFLPSKIKPYFPLMVVLALFHPIRHIFVNHPYEYIYFNEAMGGVNSAHGYYETDYSLNSMEAGLEWVKRNVENIDGKKIKLAANDPQHGWVLRKDTSRFQAHYTRYYSKFDKDWDIGVFTNVYVSPHQLREGIWPPKGTIHEIKVDDVVITAIVERTDKRDLEAYQLIAKRDYVKAISLLEGFVKDDPSNEQALGALTSAYLTRGDYNRAIASADRALNSYPEDISSLISKGISQLNLSSAQSVASAEETFKLSLNYNANYFAAYYYLALAQQRLNKVDEAVKNAQLAIRLNGKHKPSFNLLGELYDAKGMKSEGDKYRNYAETNL